MKIIEARCAGACYGVQRALDLALEAADADRKAQTLGPLIHNPQVVAKLEQAGISVADSLDEVDGDLVIIRSHGVTPETKEAILSKGLSLIDATCPHVVRAQRAAADLARSGCTVVVVGEESHPEVEGLCAYARQAGGRVLVVASADELPEAIPEPVGIVVQTTQSRAKLDEVTAALGRRGIRPIVKDTICTATAMRQQAAADLARRVDAMVVIGGHNSSNTTRLYEICAQTAPRAYHVETPGELRREDFEGCDIVGVTAGASTPEDQISAVVDRLRSWS